MKTKFTVATLRAIKPTDKPFAVTDEGCAGLQVRTLPTGRQTFQVRFRPKASGPEVLRTLGPVDSMTIAEARQKAAALIAEGRSNPKAALQRATFAEALDRLERDHLAAKKAGAQIMFVLRRECAGWSGRRLASITVDDIDDLLSGREATPAARNRLATYLRLAFSWWQQKRMVAANPAEAVGRLPEKGRWVYLKPAEIVTIWQAAQSVDATPGRYGRSVYGDLVGLIALTGVRLAEAAEATVDEVDLDAGEWLIPRERMKGGKAHLVPITPTVGEILRRRIQIAEELGTRWLFTTKGRGPTTMGTPIKHEIDVAVKRLRKGEALPWWCHAIRHGMRSGLSALGVRPDVAERVIAHLPSGVEGRYDHHAFAAEKRAALMTWEARLQEEIDPAVRKAKAERMIAEALAQIGAET